MDFLTRKVINPRQSRTSKKLGFHLQHLMVNFRLSKLCQARNFLCRAFIFATNSNLLSWNLRIVLRIAEKYQNQRKQNNAGRFCLKVIRGRSHKKFDILHTPLEIGYSKKKSGILCNMSAKLFVFPK